VTVAEARTEGNSFERTSTVTVPAAGGVVGAV
jgi:hypothetical protein